MHSDSPAYGRLYPAFQSVKENHGAPGVDGVTVGQFEDGLTDHLYILERDLRDGTYAPLPLLKILVDKGNGEARALCIPCVRDRVVQSAVLQQIEPVLEREFEDCSFAFRKGRSVRQAVHKVKEYYDQGFRWVVDSDVDAFFDRIRHELLLEKLRRYVHDDAILSLIERWIKAEVWDGTSLSVMKQGIPQGSPVSPILANLFLDELDEALLSQKQRLVRFADDFVVLCRSRDAAFQALELTNQVLRKLDLELDEAEVIDFDHGFKFLGVTFVRSLMMVPFERLKKERRVLYYPPALDMAAYYLDKRKGR